MSDFDGADVVPARTAARFPGNATEDVAELLPSQFERRGKLPEREGLPPGYRMRADAHYVEQLTARVEEPDADVTLKASDARFKSEPAMLEQLTQAVSTIQSATAMLTSDASPMARKVAIDLVRAESFRAAWQLRAAAILGQSYRWRFRSVLVGAVLARVAEGLSTECRLSGMDVALSVTDWNATAELDEDAFICGVSGAIAASAALASGNGAMRLTLTARSVDGRARTIEIVYDAIAADQATRLFDAGWTSRPGGWAAAIGAAVAKAVAERHGGEAAFIADGRTGTLRLTFNSPTA